MTWYMVDVPALGSVPAASKKAAELAVKKLGGTIRPISDETLAARHSAVKHNAAFRAR